MTRISFYLTILLYGAATVLYLSALIKSGPLFQILSRRVLVSGLLAHCLSTIHRFSAAGHLPVTNMHESLSFMALAIVITLLVFDYRYKASSLGAFVMPVVMLMVTASSMFTAELKPLNPALRSLWIYSHTILAFGAYACFTIAGGTAVMYLIQSRFLKTKHLGPMFKKLPSLDTLDDIGYRCLTFGFPMLTVAIITGAIWASKAWGSYWSWDPKETWSFITWLIYAALLHGRLTTGWRGRRAAILTVAGFFVMLFTFIGVNLFIPGLHSYN